MARHAAVLLLCAALLASAPAPTKAGLWDSIKDVFHDTWDKTTGVFSSVGTYVECKAIDVTTFSMDPCWQAPTTDLCTAACKAQLAKLPDRCLTRLADEVAKQGNTNVTARLQEQLTACGRNITVPASAAGPAWGSVLVPLAAVGLSAALLELLRP